MAGAKKSPRGKSNKTWTDEEKEAMKQHASEMKRAAKGGKDDDQEPVVLAKIATMAEPDRSMAKRVHAVVKAAAPGLTPRLWYGMPAYSKDGHVLCHFQDAKKFKTRYSTIGFSDEANLDDGSMWPVAFALKELGPAEEARITALVKKAVG